MPVMLEVLPRLLETIDRALSSTRDTLREALPMSAAMPRELLSAARAPYRRCGQHGVCIMRAANWRTIRRIARSWSAGCCRIAHGCWIWAADWGCWPRRCAPRSTAARTGAWPAHWPRRRARSSIRGIELCARTVERARRALGGTAEFVQGDIRAADIGASDAVVMLDVLHYIDAGAQQALLERVHEALRPAGHAAAARG